MTVSSSLQCKAFQSIGPLGTGTAVARTLGRPLCCRAFLSRTCDIKGLLHSIDVALPAHVQPEWVGGADIRHRPGWRSFNHCATVVLWARFRGPGVSPGADFQGFPDDGGQDDSFSDGAGDLSDEGHRTNRCPAGTAGRKRARSPVSGTGPTGDDGHATACVVPADLDSRGHAPLRVLPTPCRTAGKPPDLAHDEVFMPSSTLLETADRTVALCQVGDLLSKIHPIQCASDTVRVDVSQQTLLSSPVPQTAPVSGCPVPGTSDVPERDMQRPVQIQLEDALVQPPPLRMGSLSLGFSVLDIRAILCTPARLATFAEAINVCQKALRPWLIQHRDSPPEVDKVEVVCYTDGSFKEAHGQEPCEFGWACVFFATHKSPTCSRDTCLGVVSGSMPAWLDRDQSPPCAYIAECTALVYGAWVAARNFPGATTRFYSDCTAAIGAATGDTCFARQGPAGTAYGMHLLRAASSGGSISHVYVPGHSQVYGNELADQIAKAAARGLSLGDVERDSCTMWLQGGGLYLPWMALACRALQGTAAWPSVDGSSLRCEVSRRRCDPTAVLEPFLSIRPQPAAKPLQPDLPRSDTARQHAAQAPSALALVIASTTRCLWLRPLFLQTGIYSRKGLHFGSPGRRCLPGLLRLPTWMWRPSKSPDARKALSTRVPTIVFVLAALRDRTAQSGGSELMLSLCAGVVNRSGWNLLTSLCIIPAPGDSSSALLKALPNSISWVCMRRTVARSPM